ncbi:unnamed protein product [Echinostoma caproni]|uniref:Reverse transcriptase domain-containing protein n=1 Tax=Echinostoma caproni TaxID=27848 RepID=A0A183BDK0_9TREM|nr:unnamed protein product [Echinostoma caproni]
MLRLAFVCKTWNDFFMFCTYNAQFKFNEQLCRQKDNVAMGSPLGPWFANVFMAKLENNQLKSSIQDWVLYRRYVDDILCVINTSEINELLSKFNAAHQYITFTLEMKNDKMLAFLDVCLSRGSDGSVQRSVHRKAT